MGPFKYDLTPFFAIFSPSPHPHTFYDFLYSDPHTIFREFPTPPGVDHI